VIKRALLSVSDKTGIVELAGFLAESGTEILSTGGTHACLQKAGIEVRRIEDYTGFPEIMDGRVKTLHPKIHGGLLGRHHDPFSGDAEQMRAHSIEKIDLLAVNLYPFAKTVKNPEASLEDALANIDIGGPAMIRAASKNYRNVAVLTAACDYPALMEEIKANAGVISEQTRFELALKAFSHTAEYDGMIANYLASQAEGTEGPAGSCLHLSMKRIRVLRYGENPHQKAALYRTTGTGVANARQVCGKTLSYNNLSDAEEAWSCVRDLKQPACVIVKHTNPCGAALGEDLKTAYSRAFSADSTSAFGGILAFNRPLDGELVKAILDRQFCELLIAPEMPSAAIEEILPILGKRKNVRLLLMPSETGERRLEYRAIGGGMLVQEADSPASDKASIKMVSRRQPSEPELADLLFGWHIARFVKSNAMVLVRDGQTLGIGAGQMSRVDSSKIALMKAREGRFDVRGAVLASDAFLPFRDGLDQVAEQGVSALIQPGGSMRDREVIEAADEANMAMVFTGQRHFRH